MVGGDQNLSLGRMENRFSFPHAVETVLLYQRIDHQTAIDTAMDNRAGREIRLPLLNHQSFAFLTRHATHLLLI